MRRRSFFRSALASLVALLCVPFAGRAEAKPIYHIGARKLYRVLTCPHCNTTNNHIPLLMDGGSTEYRCLECARTTTRKTGCQETEAAFIYSKDELIRMGVRC
jgi:transposase-like protein